MDPAAFELSGHLVLKRAAELGIDSLSDIATLPVEQRTFCVESEFASRADGFVPMLEAYGLALGEPEGVPRENVSTLDTGAVYTATDQGACTFGEVFTTDGRIKALNLELVEDPGVMILYNLSFTFQDAVYKKHAKVYDELADKIFKDLDEEKMAELNAKVDVDGQPAKQVAQQYLEDIGVL